MTHKTGVMIDTIITLILETPDNEVLARQILGQLRADGHISDEFYRAALTRCTEE